MRKEKFPREYGWAATAIAVLICIFFYDVVFGGKTFKVSTANAQAFSYGPYGQSANKPPFIPVNGTDASVMEEPVYAFIGHWLRQGIVPLWNPHQACGFSLIAMLEIGLFFPLHVLVYFLPDAWSIDLLVLVRLFLAALSVYWLMRLWRMPQLSSIAAAIVMIFTGPMLVLQYWTTNVDMLAPLVLFATEFLIRNPSRRSIAALAAVVGLTFIAGHPEHIFFVNLLGFLYFVFRFLTLRKKTYLQSSIALASAYALGILSASIILWPFLWNLAFDFWKNRPEATGLGSCDDKARLMSLALPFFYQKVPLTFKFEFSGWYGGYLGMIPLALASLSLFSRQRRGLNYFFAALAFLIIAKTYCYWFINWIGILPIFDTCRYSIHTPQIVALCLAVLSGMGVRVILLRRKLFLKGLVFAGIMIAWIFWEMYKIKNPENLALAWKAAGFGLLMLGGFQILLWFIEQKKLRKRQLLVILVVVLLAFDLFHYIHRDRVKRFTSYPVIPYIEFLKQDANYARAYGVFWAFYPNTATAYGMDDLGIFFSLLPNRFVQFVNNLVVKDNFTANLAPPALRAIPIEHGKSFVNLLGAKYIVTQDQERLNRLYPRFDKDLGLGELVYNDEVSIFLRPGAFERVFVVHRAAFLEDKDSIFPLLKMLHAHLDKIVILNQKTDEKIKAALADTPDKDQSWAKIISYTPNKVVIKASMEHAGFVVLSDAFHPDWKAYVDGKQTKIYPADYLIRSVFLPAGDHKIEFVFRPASFYWGAIVSALAILVIIFLGWKKSK